MNERSVTVGEMFIQTVIMEQSELKNLEHCHTHVIVQTVVMEASPGSYAQQHVVGTLLRTMHKVTSCHLITFRSYMKC